MTKFEILSDITEIKTIAVRAFASGSAWSGYTVEDAGGR
jgi:hypothetical protein